MVDARVVELLAEDLAGHLDRTARQLGRLVVERNGDRRAAVLLVHPDLTRCGHLARLRDDDPVDHEDRGLALGAHRVDQRLHHPRARPEA